MATRSDQFRALLQSALLHRQHDSRGRTFANSHESFKNSILAVLGLVPPLAILLLWNEPAPTTSESINDARRPLTGVRTLTS
jgi:hypothetical protein